MRPRTITAGALGVCLIGFLGFRIIDLEQRVARLSEQLGVPAQAGEATESARSKSSSASATGSGATGFEQRLRALEARVNSLHAATQKVRSPNADDLNASNLAKEQAILSVVERENSRIRDVQLEWHRARWIETREQALTVFASQHRLQPAQTVELRDALEREVDAMVKILKRPELAEDPDQAVGDWQAVLAETDARAQKVLTAEQQQAWWQGRVLERRVLWPWLPDKGDESARK